MGTGIIEYWESKADSLCGRSGEPPTTQITLKESGPNAKEREMGSPRANIVRLDHYCPPPHICPAYYLLIAQVTGSVDRVPEEKT